MAINTAPSVTEKDIKLLVKSLNALTEKFSQSSPDSGRTFSNTAPTRKPMDSDRRAKEAEKIMRSAIKPTIGPFAKIMGRFVESAFGRAMIHWVGTTKSYFSNFAGQASSLMNKAFGQFLDDLQPIIQTLKTSVNFLYDIILKPIAKLFSGIAKWGWGKITDAFTAIKDKFSIKKKPEEIVAKAVVRQVDYLKRIDLNTRRIERNTRKEGSAYRRAHLGALLMGMGNRTAPTGPPTNTATNTATTGGIFGGIVRFLGSARSMVSDLLGPLLGPLLTIGIPLLLGGSLLKGLWDNFMENNPEISTWIDKNIKEPFDKFWEDTVSPKIDLIGSKMVDAIIDGFASINPFGEKDPEIKKINKKIKEKEAELDKYKFQNTREGTGTAFDIGGPLKWAIDFFGVGNTPAQNAEIKKREKEIKELENQKKSLQNKGKKYSNNTSIEKSSAGFIGPLRPELYSAWNKFWGSTNLGAFDNFVDTWGKNSDAEKAFLAFRDAGNAYAAITPLSPLTKNTAPPLTGNSVTIPLTQAPTSPYNDALLTPYTSSETIDADKMLEKVSLHEMSGKKNWNQLHFPGTKFTAMGPLGLTVDWWKTYSKMTPNATQDTSARGDETEVRAVWKTALKDYEKELKAKNVDVSELNLMLCHFMGAKTAASYLARGRDFMMNEVWNDATLKANKAEGKSFYEIKDRVAKAGHFSTSGAILDTSGSTGETIGDWFQNVSRKIGKAVGLTPAEMQTLFNPAPRTSVEAADREREQNKKYREIGEYNPNEKPGNTTLVNNNNVANSSAGSGYSQAPRIFDSVFPQFEWVLANH